MHHFEITVRHDGSMVTSISGAPVGTTASRDASLVKAAALLVDNIIMIKPGEAVAAEIQLGEEARFFPSDAALAARLH